MQLTTKQKRDLTRQIKDICTDNQFFRVDGSWEGNQLHIGVQPDEINILRRLDIETDEGMHKRIVRRFNRIIREIKKIRNVSKAKSENYYAGFHSMAGILVEI